ncbi:hypothetical protein IWQ62_006635, partial [Dispira parvispora]
LQAKDTELQAKDTELQAKDTELQAGRQQVQAKETELQTKDTELQAKDTEIQVKDTELKFRGITISTLEKKVEKVEYEKGQGLENVINILFKYRDFIDATAECKYKNRYDQPMSDLHTRLRDVEEAYLAKCRALEAVTAEYSQVVAFASSNGTIPPPDEPTLARILMEYQEELMISQEREEQRRRLEGASERRRRIIQYRVPSP